MVPGAVINGKLDLSNLSEADRRKERRREEKHNRDALPTQLPKMGGSEISTQIPSTLLSGNTEAPSSTYTNFANAGAMPRFPGDVMGAHFLTATNSQSNPNATTSSNNSLFTASGNLSAHIGNGLATGATSNGAPSNPGILGSPGLPPAGNPTGTSMQPESGGPGEGASYQDYLIWQQQQMAKLGVTASEENGGTGSMELGRTATNDPLLAHPTADASGVGTSSASTRTAHGILFLLV